MEAAGFEIPSSAPPPLPPPRSPRARATTEMEATRRSKARGGRGGVLEFGGSMSSLWPSVDSRWWRARLTHRQRASSSSTSRRPSQIWQRLVDARGGAAASTSRRSRGDCEEEQGQRLAGALTLSSDGGDISSSPSHSLSPSLSW
ncbi:unnamed protein product [Urochloa humidicola]